MGSIRRVGRTLATRFRLGILLLMRTKLALVEAVPELERAGGGLPSPPLSHGHRRILSLPSWFNRGPASVRSRRKQLGRQKLQQNRPRKVVTVRRGWQEDSDVVLDRRYASHPEDRSANVVLFKFCDDEELADEG